jgi:hypothetical protein
MKTSILTILALFCLSVGQSYAQSTFGLDTAKKTGKTIVVGDNTYPIEVTTSGSEFIRLTSTHGSDYAVWVGSDTKETHEGLPVRISKKGKRFVIIISKNGNPYPKYLK